MLEATLQAAASDAEAAMGPSMLLDEEAPSADRAPQTRVGTYEEGEKQGLGQDCQSLKVSLPQL